MSEPQNQTSNLIHALRLQVPTPLHPTDSQRERLNYCRDTCRQRQLYNHALNEFEQIPNSAGTLNQRVRQVRDQLPDLTDDWWAELTDSELYSTVAQAAVMRIEDSVKSLSELKRNGYNVGSLNWKAPSEFRSFIYVQSGFEFDNKNGQTVLSLSFSKLADIPINILLTSKMGESASSVSNGRSHENSRVRTTGRNNGWE